VPSPERVERLAEAEHRFLLDVDDALLARDGGVCRAARIDQQGDGGRRVAAVALECRCGRGRKAGTALGELSDEGIEVELFAIRLTSGLPSLFDRS
jgi:hypothetical protein